MQILFLTSRFPKNQDHFTLEKELIYAFAKDGHHCTVANILEKKNGDNSYLENISTLNGQVELLHIKTGNLFNDVSLLEKKFTVLSLPYILPKTIKTLLPQHKFDLIIAYGPYLCSSSIILPLKKYYGCKAILMQWDIFPQNAFDLGIIKNKLIFYFLKHKQKQKFNHYDLIVCNSEGNVRYFANHFSRTKDKLFLLHNCESPTAQQIINKKLAREKFQLDISATVLIFGGNIGVPQALENIVEIAEQLSNNPNIYFIISGQGTEADKIKKLSAKYSNIRFIDFLPSKDYEELLAACDYGIISLSSKFTVPNFPAKVTSYLKLGIPIFACLDDAAFDDLGQFIRTHDIGLSIQATNYKLCIKEIENFLLDKKLHREQSAQTKVTFDKYFNIHNVYNDLLKKIEVIN